MIIRTFCLGVSLLCLISCQSKNTASIGTPSAAPVMKVQGFVVVPHVIDESFNVSGTLIASEQTEIHSEISGRVIALPLREGMNVKAGEVLVKIYDADLQAQRKKLEVQLEIAQKNEQRVRDLLSLNGSTQLELDMARLQVSNIAADIDIIKSSISKTEIRAPFNGRVGLRSISPGAYITPATNIATLREMGQLKLDFEVPEKHGATMSIGQEVSFTINGSRETYHAKIIATDVDVSMQNRSLKVRALVPQPGSTLVPGVFANVICSMSSSPSALMIPTQALIPQARDKKVIVVKDGKAKFVSVTTGFRSNTSIEIVSGLAANDTIVTTGLLFVKPESKVEISSFVQ